MKPGILFLEDDRSQLVLYRRLSKKYLSEYRVFFTETVSAAESILANEPISLAVLDLMIPSENGADLIMKMKQNSSYKDIKIIVASSAKKDSLLYHSLEGYIDRFVSKPVDMAKFAELVKEIHGEDQDRLH